MAHAMVFFQSAAAEKSHGAGQKLYGAADFQSATSIFQFFKFSIFPSAGSRAGYVRVKTPRNCLIMRSRVRRAGTFLFFAQNSNNCSIPMSFLLSLRRVIQQMPNPFVSKNSPKVWPFRKKYLILHWKVRKSVT